MPKEKLSPQQKEKKKKEEAERKRLAEEEARLKAEAEEAERKKQEQIAEEKFWVQEYEERKLRWVELPELENLWKNSEEQLKTQRLEQKKLDEWARYMKCDGSPDPTVLKDINMFISLYRENTLSSSYEELIEGTALIHQLIEELEEKLEDTLDESVTETKRKTYTQTVEDLQTLLKDQLDLCTHDLLCKASQMTDIDTNNLEKIITTEKMTLGLWGNISKNPRIKSYEFSEMGVSIELPKLLTLSDIAIRVLVTKFDHVSHLCKSYHLREKENLDVLSVTSEIQRLEEEAEEEEEEQEEAIDLVDNVTNTLNILPTEENSDEKKDEEKEILEDDEKPPDWNIPTPELLEYEEYTEGDNEGAINLRAFNVVGGVIYFNLLLLPPQPKYINNWTITQVLDPPHLRYMDYYINPAAVPQYDDDPQTVNETQDQMSAVKEEEEGPAESQLDHSNVTEGAEQDQLEPVSSNEPEAAEEEEDPEVVAKRKGMEKRPLQVTLKLPDDVLICEEPQVVIWNEEKKWWITEGFLDKTYTEEERTVSFRICQWGTIALVQDAYINMPYQTWELRARGLNHAQLSITAAISQVEIQIKEGLVCLTQPADKPELSYLINKWMKLPLLIKHMKYSGLNAFPEEDSYKYVKVLKKNRAAEDRLYREMGDVGSIISFSWSQWNARVNDEQKIIVQGAEQRKDEPLIEDDWSIFYITKNRAERLLMDELSQEFSPERAEGSVYHTNLYHMAMEELSEVGKKRLYATSPSFKHNVYQVLRATRVVTHS